MKKMDKKDYIYLSVIFSIIIGFILFLAFKGKMFGSTIDYVNQHIVIPEYLRKLFYSNFKLFPNFALNLGMGQNIFYLSYYGLYSPIILLSYLFPFIPMYVYIPCISILMLMLSVFLFYGWIKDKYNSNIAFIATFLFAFNAPFFYHFHRHIMFVIYMPFLIWALKSVDKYFENKDPLYIIISVFLMILTSYYFSVSGILVIGIYSLYKLFSNKKYEKKNIGNIIFYVTVSILMSSFFLLPTIYALFNGRIETLTSQTITIWNLLSPVYNHIYTFYNNYYGWGITFIYIVSIIYAFLSKKKENIFLGIIFSLIIIFPVFSYLLNGLMYVDGKCFIPFIPIFLLLVCNFIKNVFDKKVNYNLLMWISVIVGIILCFFAIGNDTLYLLFIDLILTTISLALLNKNKKSNILYIPILLISFTSFVISSFSEVYLSFDELKNINNDTYNEITNVSDNDLYRIANYDNIIYNSNKVYNINNLETTIYSSSTNSNYMNFIRNTFKNEIINRDNTTVTQPYNLLFNIYSGTKYLVSSNNSELGYKKVNEIDGVSLYENDDVLPLIYATSNVMSLREFKTLEYPYTIDALLNYAIVNRSYYNKYKTNLVKTNLDYKVINTENIEYKLEDEHYIIKSSNNAKIKLKLNKKITNKVLIISFDMNKSKEGYACSSDITINDVKNALSCSNWKYNNNNNTFEYVLSDNKGIDTLEINFTNGEFDISNIKVYTYDYNILKKLNNKVDPFIYNKDKSDSDTIVGSINVTNDGLVKTSIPYDEGFEVYVDGKRVSKVYIDNGMLGFDITKGYHTIKILYKSPLFNVGKIISILGFVILGLIIYFKYNKKILNKIKDFIKKILNKIKDFIKKTINKNKWYLCLFISLYILDLSLRLFHNSSVTFSHWYCLVPNLFSIIWILLILFLTNIFKNKIGKIIYIVCYVFSCIMFFAHTIYFSYFDMFFDFSVIKIAGEGTDYFGSVLLNIKLWSVLVLIISVFLTIKGLKNIKQDKKINIKKLIIVLVSFMICELSLPCMLGKVKNDVEWDDWRNKRIIYKNFNDNNKSMMVSGMFEYNIRNIYKTIFDDNDILTNYEKEILEDNFSNNKVASENKYTGIFKDKNLIIVQLESIDDFLVTNSIMPTLTKLSKKSLNFTNHYSYTSGGGSTFNSEFMINTGYSSAYNYNQSAYTFSKNNYYYSLPNIFKREGYTANVFHMNTSEYYSRGSNYKAFGYDSYNGLKDLNIYNNYEYWLDTELVKNETFINKMLPTDKPFVSYLITYSAHMPFRSTLGTCSLLTDQKDLTEYDCLKLQAKETDNMIKLLLEKLEERNLSDNTVIVFVSDHYLYTLENKDLLKKYKDTETNLINHTPFMIYNNGKVVSNIKKTNSQLDILPTILNLFGMTYFENNYIGRDILSSNYNPLVFFPDGSWYDGSTYVVDGEYKKGKSISKNTINKNNSLVKRKMTLNDAVIKSDYFSDYRIEEPKEENELEIKE